VSGKVREEGGCKDLWDSVAFYAMEMSSNCWGVTAQRSSAEVSGSPWQRGRKAWGALLSLIMEAVLLCLQTLGLGSGLGGVHHILPSQKKGEGVGHHRLLSVPKMDFQFNSPAKGNEKR
jgi:hypothetical protein